MSNVSTKYSTSPSQNLKLGGLSLKEGETRYRDINDLFRQIMADARVESNEVRQLLNAANTNAANAAAAAVNAASSANKAVGSVGQIQTQIASAQTLAGNAENNAETALARANQALTNVTAAQASAAAAQESVNTVASSLTALTAQVNTLANAQQTSATLVQVDGTTMSNANGELKAQNVEIANGVLATSRGQLGRSAVSTNADLDLLVNDGWYAVGGAEAHSLPDGVTSGVLRVSSGYVSGSVAQMLFCPDSTLRVFVRSAVDGITWLAWKELIFLSQIGSGLSFENGTLSADLSTVLPPAGEGDENKVLSGSGTWVETATADEINYIRNAIEEMEDSLNAVNTNMEALKAETATPPDGVTVVVTDDTLSVPIYFGASAEEDGIAGLVPPASAGDQNKFLKGDGTFGDPDFSISVFTGATEEEDGDSGLVPAPLMADRTKFLRGDGVFADPIENIEEVIEDKVEEAIASMNIVGGGEASSPVSGDLAPMTKATIDWICLGYVRDSSQEPEPEMPEPIEPEEEESGEEESGEQEGE